MLINEMAALCPPVLRLAEEAASTPKPLQLVVDDVFVQTLEAVGDAEAAAFVFVRFILAIGLTVAPGG